MIPTGVRPQRASLRRARRHAARASAVSACGPTALELYLALDREHEPPDGVFEMSFVRGFVRSFAAGASLAAGESAFHARRIGTAQVLRTLTPLTDGRRTLWVAAYIYPRTPSLTFLAIRPEVGGGKDIEAYLAGIAWK